MQSQGAHAIEFLQRFFAADEHLSEQEAARAQANLEAPVRARQQRLDFDQSGDRDERQH